MKKYFADVRFNTFEFEADSEEQANQMIHKLIDQLGDVDTDISWDDVTWDIYKEGDY